MAQQVKVKKKSKLLSRLVLAATLVFIAYAVFVIVSNFSEVRSQRQKIADVKQQQALQQEENDELSAMIGADDKTEYVERVARDKLNMVYSDEQVYCVIPEN